MSLSSDDRGGSGAAGSGAAMSHAPKFDYSSFGSWRDSTDVFLQRCGAENVHKKPTTKVEFDALEAKVASWADEALAAALALVDGTAAGGSSSSGASGNTNAGGNVTAADIKEARRLITAQLERSRKVFGILWQALPEELRAQSAHISQGHAYGLWQWLTMKFESTEQDRVGELLLKWQQLGQDIGEGFDAWRSRVNKLAAQLEQAGEKPSDRMYQWTMTDKLQPRYTQAVLALKAGGKFKDAAAINWEEVAQFLNTHERNVARIDGDGVEDKAMAAAAAASGLRQGRSHAQYALRQAPASHDQGHSGPRTLADVQCFRCQGFGHFQSTCPQNRQGGSGRDNDAAGGGGRGGHRGKKPWNKKPPSGDRQQAKAVVGNAADSDDSGSDEVQGKHRAVYAAVRGKKSYAAIVQSTTNSGGITARSKVQVGTPGQSIAAALATAQAKTARPEQPSQWTPVKVRKFKQSERRGNGYQVAQKKQVSLVESKPSRSAALVGTAAASRGPNGKPSQATPIGKSELKESQQASESEQQALSACGANEHCCKQDGQQSSSISDFAWGVDTMASLHLSGNKNLLSGLKDCKPVKVEVADGGDMVLSQMGTVHLRLQTVEGKVVCIAVKNVYYHPSVAVNLLSMSVLTKEGWSLFSGRQESFMVTGNRNKVQLSTQGRIHVLKSANGHAPGTVCNAKVCSAMTIVPSAAVLKYVRMHEQLNHMSYDSMQKLLAERHVTDLPTDRLSDVEKAQVKQLVRECRSCLEGKGHRTAFGQRGLDKGSSPGEVLHMDCFEVSWSDSITGEKRREYGLVAEAALGQWRWSAEMNSKDEGPAHVIDIIQHAKRQFGCKVKRLYVDGGTEFINARVQRFCKGEGIELHWPPADTEQLRGGAERSVRSIKELVRTLLRQGHLDHSLWKYACVHAVYVWNRAHVCRRTGKTPYETMYGRKASRKHFGVFGCDAFVWVPKEKRETWGAKVEPGIYLGHVARRHSAQVLLLRTRKVEVSRDITFRLDSFAHSNARQNGQAAMDRMVNQDHSSVPPPGIESWDDAELNLGDAAEDEAAPQGGLNAASSSEEFKEQQVAVEDEKQYAVESILSKRVNKVTGLQEYRVQWVGWPKSNATWEPAAAIDQDVPDRVREFEDLQQGMRRSTRSARKESSASAQAAAPTAALTATDDDVDGAESDADTESQEAVHMVMSAFVASQTPEERVRTHALVMAVQDSVALLEKQTPKTYREAMDSPSSEQWQAAMRKELASCERHEVWDLVDRASLPANANILPVKWVYRVKTDSDGALTEYKARLCPKGFRQKKGIDYNEVFAGTGKYKTLRAGLALSAKFNHELEQLDVPTAFLRADLPDDEFVYMELPEGMRDGNEGKVCLLKKALYGLKQAPRQWFLTLFAFLKGKKLGWQSTVSDPCLLYKRSRTGRLMLLFVFVDDFQGSFHASDRAEWGETKAELHARFETKDMGESKWILGMRITRDRKAGTITLDQELYVTKALEKFGFEQCRTAETPEAVGAEHQEPNEQQQQPADAQLFMEIVGTLMYAAISTRLDIAHAVHYLASHMREPTELHMTAAQRVLRYLAGTSSIGLIFGSRNGGIFADSRGHARLQADVSAWADADWANNRQDRKSITGWVAKLNGDPISWSSKKQRIVAQSTCEAELYAEAAAIQEVLWLRGLLSELGLHVQMGSLVHGDNQSTIAVSKNGVRSERTKHVDVKYHFVTETIESGQVQLKWVSTKEQHADIFTKALPAPAFLHLRRMLMQM